MKYGRTKAEVWTDRALIAFAVGSFLMGAWSAIQLSGSSPEPGAPLSEVVRHGQSTLALMTVCLGAGLMGMIAVGLATSRRTAARNHAAFLEAIEVKAAEMRAEVDGLLEGSVKKVQFQQQPVLEPRIAQ